MDAGRRSFSIVRQPIGDALKNFAEQAGLQVMFASEAMPPGQKVGLSGRYTPAEALAMLLAGSDLTPVYDTDGNVAIHRSREVTPAEPPAMVRAEYKPPVADSQDRKPVQLAQAVDPGPVPAPAAGRARSNASESPHASLIEEVVVTAQKREQSLQDVGISVTAFTGDQLTAMGFTQLQDMQLHTPGLQVFGYGSGSMTTFNLRGSAQNDFADHQEQPIAVYNDNAYVSFIGGVGLPLFDVARVEVLRGPQGTLFGRNATGGVLQILSNRPTREFEAYGEVQVGEYDKLRFEGAVSGPLTDTLSGRLSVLRDVADGYLENTVGPDSGDADSLQVRGQLLFEPNDDLSVLLNVRESRYDQVGQLYGSEAAITDFADGLVKPAQPGDAAHQAFCLGYFGTVIGPGSLDCLGNPDDGDALKAASLAPMNADRDSQAVTGTITWEFDAFTITSVTDWQQLDKDYLEAPEFAAGADLVSFVFDADSSQVSQELRLNGEMQNFRWVLGAYYLNIDGEYQTGTNSDAYFGLTTDNKYQMETESYAFFGQGEYDFAEDWTVIGGLRWTEDEKHIDYQPVCRDAVPGVCAAVFPPQFAQLAGPFSDQRGEGEWSGVIELDWRASEDLLLYVKGSRGSKAGGYNSGVFFFWEPQNADFDGEVLNAVEGGFKSTLFDGRAQFNASAFYYDYKNFQTFVQLGTSFTVSNVDSEIVGAEFELRTNPWEGWEFMFGLSLLDAVQKDVRYSGVTRDRDNPISPSMTFNGLGRYEWAMFGGSMAAQMDFSYVDERNYNGIDHPALIADSYVLANARLSYTTADERWNVALWVNNLGDELYFPIKFDLTTFQGSLATVPASPRWIGGTVRFTWN